MKIVKIILKIVKITLLVLVSLLLLTIIGSSLYIYIKANNQKNENYALLGKEAPTLIHNNIQAYRDLNKNGKMDIYEDVNAPIEERVDDILSQMNLEEKAGTMFITMIGMTNKGNPLDTPVLSTNIMDIMAAVMLPSNSEMIARQKINNFNSIQAFSPEVMATYNNNVQRLAERTRLGIPITLATDPRHSSDYNVGAAIHTPSFSQWPTPLGLAATRDTNLVKTFANIARQEYLAVGFRLSLHPTVDLATEPRWARISSTFGEDAALATVMSKAYVEGFQGDSITHQSVACMSKHFSGGGPQQNGEDAHFDYGREQVYPGDNFDYHLLPFTEGVLPAKTAQIMPYYGIPIDQTDENVAFGFNKTIITKLLRDSLKFEGVVCTDWNIITDGKLGTARAWGVENLTAIERVEKVLNAGCDQFGGENAPHLIVELVKKGRISEERINQSVKRILRDKFRLGLFDNPYVVSEKAGSVAGNKEFVKKGREAQAKSMVLLKNDGIFPLNKGVRIYLEGIKDTKAFTAFGTVVKSPKKADFIIKRITTPFDERKDNFLERFFHQGRLFYTPEEEKEIIDVITQKPSIVIANIERPTILTTIDKNTHVLLADFGTEDEVLAEVLFGEKKAEGKLPVELPSSWDAVLKQKEDVPYDSENPLYPFGFGLEY